jgi:hypothetical protein
MNFGAKNDKDRQYNTMQMIKDSNPEKVEKSTWNMLKRQFDEAYEWYENRGNAGDNVPIDELEALGHAIDYMKVSDVIEHSSNILSTKMHPTARDIVGNVATQAIYNVCGKRAYKYEQ